MQRRDLIAEQRTNQRQQQRWLTMRLGAAGIRSRAVILQLALQKRARLG